MIIQTITSIIIFIQNLINIVIAICFCNLNAVVPPCDLLLRFAFAICFCDLLLRFAFAICFYDLLLRFAFAICFCDFLLRFAFMICFYDRSYELGALGSMAYDPPVQDSCSILRYNPSLFDAV